MSGFGGVWTRLLAGAIEAARVTLRDLDDTDVPAPLTRIAAAQGGRLPPPLAGRLLAELDSNEWLRSKVAEDFAEDESDPSWLFLHRPGAWWLSLAELADAAEQSDMQRKLAATEDKLAAAEAKMAVAAKRAKEQKKEAAAAIARVKSLEASSRSEVAARNAVEMEKLDAIRADLAESEDSLRSLRGEHLELQVAFDGLRRRLAKARRSRGSSGAGPGGSSFIPGDPVKLARMIDLQSAAFGRTVKKTLSGSVGDERPLALGAGVRPDSSDAIRWLIDLEEAVVVLVDGYNAQFHMGEADFTSGASRRRLVEVLQRVRNAATAPHRVVAVFDSTLPGARDARTSLGGVEVRFAEEDRIADEEIVEMAAEFENVVVISSDREVREGAEANGAVVLWSEALAAWVARS